MGCLFGFEQPGGGISRFRSVPKSRVGSFCCELQDSFQITPAPPKKIVPEKKIIKTFAEHPFKITESQGIWRPSKQATPVAKNPPFHRFQLPLRLGVEWNVPWVPTYRPWGPVDFKDGDSANVDPKQAHKIGVYLKFQDFAKKFASLSFLLGGKLPNNTQKNNGLGIHCQYPRSFWLQNAFAFAKALTCHLKVLDLSIDTQKP